MVAEAAEAAEAAAAAEWDVAEIQAEREHDDVLDGLLLLLDFERRLKEMVREYKKRCVDWCVQNERELRVSEKRWFDGEDVKNVRCVDPEKALEILLDLSDGSFSTMVECLGANAIKQGWFKKFLKQHMEQDAADRTFRQLFETTYRPSLDEHGKPKLVDTDLTFVR